MRDERRYLDEQRPQPSTDYIGAFIFLIGFAVFFAYHLWMDFVINV